MSKCCSHIRGYRVYKQGWLTLVGDVLSANGKLERAKLSHGGSRERQSHWPCYAHNLWKLCGFIFVNLHSFVKFANFTSFETYTVNEDITLTQSQK